MASIVGIDASRYSIAQRTGTETYSFELLNAMAGLVPDSWNVRLYANKVRLADASELEKLGAVRAIPFPRFWTHVRLSAEIVRHRPDVLFVPSHVIPLVHPRSVVTIHDLGYLYEPDSHPARQVRMLDATTRWNARMASRIVAISGTTKRDLIERYEVSEDRIRVVYHGVSSRFKPPVPSEIARVRQKLHLPERFVLAVGTIQPRKNLGVLAKAVAQVRSIEPEIGLVLAGRKGWMAEDVLTEVHSALPDGVVRVLDYVDEADLPSLYGTASAVAMVSRYEGFGLPVLEAMACGAHVVISDTPALVEVAGGAAVISRTGDVGDLADALIRAMSSTKQATEDGIARAAQFTWERCSRETIAVLAECLSDRDSRQGLPY